MKRLIFLAFIFFFISASAQEDQISAILQNVKRDSTDKRCKLLFYDLYNCFESDEGQMNPKMVNATLTLFNYKSDPNLPNKQMVLLLWNYTMAAHDYDKALKWIQALNDEYRNVYGESNPLILLYKGETLEQGGHNQEAHTLFMAFLKEYPQSVNALVNVYVTETDGKLAKRYYDQLKSQHPNHWEVKNLKEK